VRCSFSTHGGHGHDRIRSPGVSQSRFAAPPAPPGSPEWLELDRRLPADHPARWISRFVDALDLGPLRAAYRGVGSEAYPPDLMLKMILWQFHDKRPSPAQWARAARIDLAMLWLGQGIRPSRSAWYAFRDRLGPSLAGLNDGVIRRAQAEGFLDPRCGVIDGTAVRSQASRHRLQDEEHLRRRRDALRQALREDEAGTPAGARPGWMARTARGRRQQARRYAVAAAVLGRRLAENARKPKDRRLEGRHVVVSVSDPEAALGRDKEKVFAPLFTVSTVVDMESLMILAHEVFPRASDARTLAPMLDRVHAVLGRQLEQVVGDAGFVSVPDLQACAARGVSLYGPIQENDLSGARPPAAKLLPKAAFTWDEATRTYLCPRGHRLALRKRQRKRRVDGEPIELEVYGCAAGHCRVCPLRGRCTRNAEKGRTITRRTGEELLEEHRRRMEDPEAKRLRKRRGSVIERTFGDWKEHRALRRFHGRGLEKARTEAGLTMLLLNAMTCQRLRAKAASPGKTAG